MDEPPRDLHDIMLHHNFYQDLKIRRAMIAAGVFFVPIATKQCSISLEHTSEDIDFTLACFAQAVRKVFGS